MSIPSYKREVLRKLFSTLDWCDLYQLHVEKLISPAQIAMSLNDLSETGIIETDGIKARLTDDGRNWVLRNRVALFANVDRSWSKPVLKKESALDPSAPYLPRLRSIDKKFFGDTD